VRSIIISPSFLHYVSPSESLLNVNLVFLRLVMLGSLIHLRVIYHTRLIVRGLSIRYITISVVWRILTKLSPRILIVHLSFKPELPFFC